MKNYKVALKAIKTILMSTSIALTCIIFSPQSASKLFYNQTANTNACSIFKYTESTPNLLEIEHQPFLLIPILLILSVRLLVFLLPGQPHPLLATRHKLEQHTTSNTNVTTTTTTNN